MYFDLEFNQKENEGKNVDEMVDILVSVILEALHEKYAIEGQEDWIVELDSSTKGTVIYMLFQLLIEYEVSFLLQLYSLKVENASYYKLFFLLYEKVGSL